MVALIIACITFVRFYRGARRAGANPAAWGLLGVACFYAPLVLLGGLDEVGVKEVANAGPGLSPLVRWLAGTFLGICLSLFVYDQCLRRVPRSPAVKVGNAETAEPGDARPCCAACQTPLPPCASLCPRCGCSQQRTRRCAGRVPT